LFAYFATPGKGSVLVDSRNPN